MRQTARHRLSERELHEYVAEVEGHDSQVTGAVGEGRLLLCADGYDLPFADRSVKAVLLIAALEHTYEPWRLLAEAHRVLEPGDKVVIVVPNDWTMSAGRLPFRALPYALNLCYFVVAEKTR